MKESVLLLIKLEGAPNRETFSVHRKAYNAWENGIERSFIYWTAIYLCGSLKGYLIYKNKYMNKNYS